MIKVVEFKDLYDPDFYKDPLSGKRFELEKTALEQLNEYLSINDKGIDLIEVQTHSDRFVLVYREIEYIEPVMEQAPPN